MPAEIVFINMTIMDTNLTWDEPENGVWKAWGYNSKKNRYYFDDIGNESLSALWADDFLNQADS